MWPEPACRKTAQECSRSGKRIAAFPERPVKLCGWRGQGPGWWALRLLEFWVIRPRLCGLSLVAVVGHHSFMAKGCVDDMTKVGLSSWLFHVLLLPADQLSARNAFVRPKGVLTLSTPG